MSEVKEVHIYEEVFEPLGKRILNSLMNSDFDSLEELDELSDKELTAIKGITKNSINEIRGLLAARGFEKSPELDEVDVEAKLKAAHKLTASRGVPDEDHVREKDGSFMPRRSGQIAMLCNLYDPGFRRKNNDQKLSVVIGDVVWGNKDEEWDLPRKYVDNLIARGEAA